MVDNEGDDLGKGNEMKNGTSVKVRKKDEGGKLNESGDEGAGYVYELRVVESPTASLQDHMPLHVYLRMERHWIDWVSVQLQLFPLSEMLSCIYHEWNMMMLKWDQHVQVAYIPHHYSFFVDDQHLNHPYQWIGLSAYNAH